MSGRGFESIGTGMILVSCLLVAVLVGGAGPVIAEFVSSISSRYFSSHGNLMASEHLSIYFDDGRTIEANNYDWGTFNQVGDTKTLVLYIYNRGPFDMRLNMTYDGWTPANFGQYMNLTWNGENYSLPKYNQVGVTLTLNHTVTYENNIDFNFVIHINGNEII